MLALDFRPAQVEALTGVEQGLVRKWASRYFDFRGSHAVASGTDDHRWYSWLGVQMVSVFGDVLKDLGDAAEARAALMVDTVPNLTRSGIATYSHDWRAQSRKTGDLLMVRDFSTPGPLFLTVGSVNLSMPEKAYLYNISAMQRRLADRAIEAGLVDPALLQQPTNNAAEQSEQLTAA